jgi:plasmid stabilization system protein ParE
MSLPVVLQPPAETDLRTARRWYEAQRAGLGDDFIAAVDKLLELIGAVPELYPIARADIRRGKVKRFPYVVYYRVHPNRVEVIGILHGHRNPRTWQDRI